MSKATVTGTIVFNENNPTYKNSFALYQQWCTLNKKPLWTKKEEVIKEFLHALKTGFPEARPKASQTLKVKLCGVKNHFELNGKGDYIDFKGLQKFIPTLYDKQQKSPVNA